MDDGKCHFWFPSNHSNNSTLKIHQKLFGSNFLKKQGIVFFLIFWPEFFSESMAFKDWI